jgi:ABC-type multidrug transport system ATPase subunit
MTAPAIELDNVQKRWGEFTLGPLSLTVPRGAIYALIGPNGAGKTTTLDLLMGMGEPDGGAIRLLGRGLLTDEVEIKRRTAYVSPDTGYQAWGSVGRAIDFVRGFYSDWNDAHCTRLLQEFGLRRADKISALSFGSRTKLALVIALAREAELLLLDEPTIGLDAGARHQLFAELLAFMRREDRTILISSHQLTDVERFADHCAIIDQGKLLIAGRMDELVDRYLQVDVRVAGEPTPMIKGVRILERQGDRARLLIDRTQATHADLAAAGTEVINEVPMTLEELFLALVQK